MLSAFSLAYNEENKLENWVNKNRELADEFVLIDTGSKDKTIAKAQSLGIKVFGYPWEHHFGKVKNFALTQCSGDWIINIPVDSWFEKSDFGTIKTIIQKDDILAYSFRLKQNEAIENGFIYYPEVRQTLLFKNDERIRYCGRVHETVDSALANNKLSCHALEIYRTYQPYKETDNTKEIYYKYLLLSGSGEINQEFADYLKTKVWG